MQITAKPYKRHIPATTAGKRGGAHWVIPTDEGEKIIHEIAELCGMAAQNWLRRMKALGWEDPCNLKPPNDPGCHPRENALVEVRIRALGPPYRDPGRATQNHPKGQKVIKTTIGILSIPELAKELGLDPSRISTRLSRIGWQDEQCLADKREYAVIAHRKSVAKRQKQLDDMELDLGALAYLPDEPRDHLLKKIPNPGRYEMRWSNAIDRRTIQSLCLAGQRRDSEEDRADRQRRTERRRVRADYWYQKVGG